MCLNGKQIFKAYWLLRFAIAKLKCHGYIYMAAQV